MEFAFLKCVISAKHLISAVHHVKGLLTPRTVLVVSVHTEAKGSYRHVVNALFKRIKLCGSCLFGKRIEAGNNAYVDDLDVVFAVDLKISARHSYEILDKEVFALGAVEVHGEVSLAETVFNVCVCNMLAVRYLYYGIL